jgi:hypothetical protein
VDRAEESDESEQWPTEEEVGDSGGWLSDFGEPESESDHSDGDVPGAAATFADPEDEGPYGELDGAARRRRLVALVAFIVVLGVGAVAWALAAGDLIPSVVKRTSGLGDDEVVTGLFSAVSDPSVKTTIESCDLNDKGLLEATGTLHIGENMEPRVYLVELRAKVKYEQTEPVSLVFSDTLLMKPGETDDWDASSPVVDEEFVGDLEVLDCEVVGVGAQILDNRTTTTKQ